MTTTTRINQNKMQDSQKEAFKDAITKLIANGEYSRIVSNHADMSHRMHGTGTGHYLGYHRFLPWHRVFILRLEEEIQKIDPGLFIPYWKWTEDRDIPEWLKNFTPSGITNVNGDPLNITRTPGANPSSPIPSRGDITNIMAENTYHRFVVRLEGAHNRVHSWVGGRMDDIFYSPADPLFWLHHTEIDRLWYEWQKNNPNEVPFLSGSEAEMDPWSETSDDVRSISSLDYEYK